MNADNTKKLTFREKKIAIIERLLDCREKYTIREWAIVQLHYKGGLTHDEIAALFQVSRPSISRSMRNIRRKALS